jgi:hypothetical protein
VTGLKILVGPLTCRVESAGQDVGLDLPIPLFGQLLLKPPRKLRKFLGRQIGDGRLKFFHAHVFSLARNFGDGKHKSGCMIAC